MKFIYNGKKVSVIEKDNGNYLVQLLNVNYVNEQKEFSTKEGVVEFLTTAFDKKRAKHEEMIRTSKHLKNHKFDDEDLVNVKKILG